MKALNFYSSKHHTQLISHRKTCTIRLGDKTDKYQPGAIVWVTVGPRFAPRKKVFTALLDRVVVKSIEELTQDDLHGENPDMSSINELLIFMNTIYDKVITPSDVVTVVYFSEIMDKNAVLP